MLFQNGNSRYEYLLIIHFIRNQMFHHVVLMWTLSANKPSGSVIVLWISSCQNKCQRSIIPSVLKRSNRC